jgi:hypothetical protein
MRQTNKTRGWQLRWNLLLSSLAERGWQDGIWLLDDPRIFSEYYQYDAHSELAISKMMLLSHHAIGSSSMGVLVITLSLFVGSTLTIDTFSRKTTCAVGRWDGNIQVTIDIPSVCCAFAYTKERLADSTVGWAIMTKIDNNGLPVSLSNQTSLSTLSSCDDLNFSCLWWTWPLIAKLKAEPRFGQVCEWFVIDYKTLVFIGDRSCASLRESGRFPGATATPQS